MTTPTLNLVLLDDNTLMANPLSEYLSSRFGSRVNISTFYDADRCVRDTPAGAHIIVLDYLVHGKATNNGQEKFTYVKKLNPSAPVTLITSHDDAVGATEEMQREASEYIINREGYSRHIVHHINKKVVVPVRKLLFYPVHKFVYFYTVRNYLMMFVVAFVAVGLLVLGGLLAVKLLGR